LIRESLKVVGCVNEKKGQRSCLKLKGRKKMCEEEEESEGPNELLAPSGLIYLRPRQEGVGFMGQ
jgi:hypothetical protein